MEWLFDRILLVVVALPALVALSLAGLGTLQTLFGIAHLPERVWRDAGLATGFATFVLAVFGIALRFDPERLGPQFVATVGGALSQEPRLLLGVDGIGLCFLISTVGLVPIALLVAARDRGVGPQLDLRRADARVGACSARSRR
ncbi:MAG: hypothetical protein IPK00_24195 [Deltaproteobacteria bacterium]|nr:hypothetical protein [Deltaproteobacteria bacterium]